MRAAPPDLLSNVRNSRMEPATSRIVRILLPIERERRSCCLRNVRTFFLDVRRDNNPPAAIIDESDKKGNKDDPEFLTVVTTLNRKVYRCMAVNFQNDDSFEPSIS